MNGGYDDGFITVILAFSSMPLSYGSMAAQLARLGVYA